MKQILIAVLTLLLPAVASEKPKKKPTEPSALDRYISESLAAAGERAAGPSAGSLWRPGSLFSDSAADLRASQIDDLVTILVSERASAVSRGVTNTARSSSTKNTIPSIFGNPKVRSTLNNLTNLSGESKLAGQGTTSRDSTLSTTLTARVTHVMPNGNLVVEGSRETTINSERQVITVRGVIRPVDLGTNNQVRSERLGQMEIRVNGKGVVGDAVRRPFFLYRLLLGLMPF